MIKMANVNKKTVARIEHRTADTTFYEKFR